MFHIARHSVGDYEEIQFGLALPPVRGCTCIGQATVETNAADPASRRSMISGAVQSGPIAQQPAPHSQDYSSPLAEA